MRNLPPRLLLMIFSEPSGLVSDGFPGKPRPVSRGNRQRFPGKRSRPPESSVESFSTRTHRLFRLTCSERKRDPSRGSLAPFRAALELPHLDYTRETPQVNLARRIFLSTVRTDSGLRSYTSRRPWYIIAVQLVHCRTDIDRNLHYAASTLELVSPCNYYVHPYIKGDLPRMGVQGENCGKGPAVT